MGVDLGPLIKNRHPLSLEDLNGRVLAVDAYNSLYQFLTIIRGEGGDPLMDSRGNVTSHLSGLFYRTVSIVEKGGKPLYVFDGRPPELKRKEISRRSELKKNAEEMFHAAVAKGDKEAARRYASMSTRLNDRMVYDAKSLLTLMGVPWVQAPSEGEAQASYLTMKGVAWATVSQDYDSLLFGSPKLARNLTVSGRRKLPKKDVYVNVSPELLHLQEVLGGVGLTREKLVDLGILVGTDFNPGGFRGVGPVKALKFIERYGRLEAVEELREELSGIDYQKVRDVFLKPEVRDIDDPVWRGVDREGVVKFLCDEHDFSEERVGSALGRLRSKPSETLERWF
ncbi:MAG: flap endonuclease-1 [Nitrososphaerota archaeon]|nr:flap endonuclease-1 [Nitrososphaerota archaeon]MDG6939383.1 flap endonuclease-1 [Nitrososphaerota archaeon]